MPLNSRLLRTVISAQAEPALRKEIRGIVRLDFQTKKDEFFEAFDSHPVTQEIEGGPTALGGGNVALTSGGNLFSLLGFDSDQKPVKSLRSFLRKTIKLGNTRKGVTRGSTIQFDTPVTIPTVEEVNEAAGAEAPLEWTDRPWTDLVARGITGLPRYLFSLTTSFKNSRSGTAIEVKKSLRGGSAGPISYIGGLLTLLKASITAGRRK